MMRDVRHPHSGGEDSWDIGKGRPEVPRGTERDAATEHVAPMPVIVRPLHMLLHKTTPSLPPRGEGYNNHGGGEVCPILAQKSTIGTCLAAVDEMFSTGTCV